MITTLSAPPGNSPTLLTAAERREWLRYSCNLQGYCLLPGAVESPERWPAETWDLSAGGVALRLCRRFEPGTLLDVVLTGAGTELVSSTLGRVCRVVAQGHHWLISCRWFAQFDPDELKLLLARPLQCTPLPHAKRRLLLRRKP
jgi:PilZ domain